MSASDRFNAAMLEQIASRAEPRQREELSKRGVSSPDQLPAEVAGEIFRQVMLEVTAATSPGAQLDTLDHGLKAFSNPRFFSAFERLKTYLEKEIDAFAMASGVDAAIVLAGLGLKVAPFDRKTPKILAEPSNIIDSVERTFSRWKTAFVGYSTCEAPFYMLFTDCIRTLRERVETFPELREIKELVRRIGAALPPDPGRPFSHGMVLIARQPGDSIATISLGDPNPNAGSVVFYGGYKVGEVAGGAPNDGYMPVPLQFLRSAIEDPEVAMWIWRPVGMRGYMN